MTASVPMQIGSLFSGAGGLDLAAEMVFGGRVVWQAEIDPAAAKVLAHRFPGIPNLGDITEVDWSTVDQVDVLCGGFPCQDSDSTGGGRHPDARKGHSSQIIDTALLHGTTAWGKYGPAIARWESLTRPAPSPTEPNSKGNPRLAAAFSEWMMGWPAGWVTAVPGVSRNDALRIVGNGVCPQQAAYALRLLLSAFRTAS